VSDQSPLVVSMMVEALVVNDPTRHTSAWMRTRMNYNVLSKGMNGAAPQTSDTNFSGPQPNWGTYYNGVYLKWRLPWVFTHGAQDSVSGITTYPQAPNRWLVVRTGGPAASRTATAWIIESDYAWPGGVNPANVSQLPSLYPRTASNGTMPFASYIGRNVSLQGGSWSETGSSLGLTAVGPGNPAFAYYQPQNNNVFSFIDPLQYAGIGASTLSYTVLGWFSSAANDPLANPGGLAFNDLLAQLDWELAANTDPSLTASWSLLCGSVDGVAWQSSANPGGGPPTGNPPISIAVGNTSVEALTALVTTQADEQAPPIEAELLEALQLDAIDVLDQPDGAAQLAERVQTSFFKKFSGGYTWSLVTAPNQTAPSTGFSAVLAHLNKSQALLDATLIASAVLRTQLYVAWWKKFVYPNAIQVSNPILQQSDLATLVTDLTQQVDAAKELIDRLRARIPHGDTQEALAAAIAAYQSQNGIPDTLQLKRSAAPQFYQANEPVVLIAGAGASGIVNDSAPALARFASQLVTGFQFGATTVTASTPNLTIPLPSLSGATGVPWTSALVTALLQEAFFLDPNNATLVGTALGNSDDAAIADAMLAPANDVGTYPTGAVTQWNGNPWHPLLLMYQSSYFAMPYGTTAAPNWQFQGGSYVLSQDAAAIQQAGLGPFGTLYLAPTASFNMEARLRQYLANNPNLPADQAAALKALLDFVQTSDNWDLLSQALDGFNDQLRLIQPGLFINPQATDATLAAKIGDAATNPPGLGLVPAQGASTTSLFQPWRAGQFFLTSLIVVDEWGQALYPIDESTSATEHVYLPPELTPVLTSLPATLNVVTGVTIDGLSPALAAANGPPLTLTVSGAGFVSDAVVAWGNTPLATSQVNANALTATVPANLLTAGSYPITVASNGTTSAPATFTVNTGVAIDTLTPSLLQTGMAPSSLVPLLVTGANFGQDAVVSWNGTNLTTVVDDAATLTAQIPATFLAAPASVAITVTTGGTTSAPATFTITDGPAVTALSPASVIAGGAAMVLTVTGVGFTPSSVVAWTPASGSPMSQLQTSFTGPEQLAAQLPAAAIASAGALTIVESTGSSIVAKGATSVIQLSPALLQPARLDFDLVSASSDLIVVGPANPGADPICGWVLPNHLDASLMAYDDAGAFLGEMSVGVETDGSQAICWSSAPSGSTLAGVATAIPHFGPFLLALSQQTPATFQAFLSAIDETMWTTQPIGAVFDKSLAVLIGRPLAMVRASLRFELAGPPYQDPSWQFTLNPAPPQITNYLFGIELGNIAQLDDGLVGYFTGDNYATFNVVQQSGASADSYLAPIGVNDNYIALPFDGTTILVSMLVDPRAPVHATTAILPPRALAVPSQLVDAALAAMNVTFRLEGVLTDQVLVAEETDAEIGANTTMLLPVPAEKSGRWSWLENNRGSWSAYPTAPNDATARLANVAPVLRQGMLQLSAPFNRKGPTP
jgi:IPT/TIG domain